MTTSPLAEPFLEAARDGVLVVQVCWNCDHAQLPPLARCEACGHDELRWEHATGQATLTSFAVMHRSPPEHAERVPYVYALVTLEEGPRIISNVVHANPADLRVGQRLTVVFERSHDDQPVPEFEPA
jgi:uncharacterized OB-fold protein